MHRKTLLLLVAAASFAAEADPDTLKELLKRELPKEDKRVIKVSVGQHAPTSVGAIIVDAEVTRKEQYLLWDTDGPPHLLREWKMDAAKQWLVKTENMGLLAYDFVRGFLLLMKTRLPVEEVLEISDYATGQVTVRLIDHTIEKYPLRKAGEAIAARVEIYISRDGLRYRHVGTPEAASIHKLLQQLKEKNVTEVYLRSSVKLVPETLQLIFDECRRAQVVLREFVVPIAEPPGTVDLVKE